MSSLLHAVLTAEFGTDGDELAVFSTDGRALTRGELQTRAARVAGGLRELGVGPGDRIAILMSNRPEYLDVVFAGSMLGAIVVHLHTSLQGHMLERQLRLTEPACVVIGADAAPRLAAVTLSAPLRTVIIGGHGATGGDIDFGQLSDADPLAERDAPVPPRAPACIYSSSGTTGPAKGVTLSHDALFAMARTAQVVMGYRPSDVAYTVTPFYHANALVFMFLAAALAGSRTVFAERFSASRFWDEIGAHGATRTSLVGSAAGILLSQPPRDDDARNTLELVAAVPRPRNAGEFERRFGVDLTEFYGSTEANLPLGIPYGEERPGTCGRVLPGWQCILRDESGEEVPDGQPGELLVRPDEAGTVSSGYWNEPERTVDLWQDLWINTGDLLRRDEDGWFYFVDRLKDAIRVSGENVASADVESSVLRHPGVAEAAAFAVPAELGEQEIMVAVVMDDGHALDPAALRATCEEHLPYYAVPRYAEQFTDLPRTPTERVKKIALRSRGVTATTVDLGRPRRTRS